MKKIFTTSIATGMAILSMVSCSSNEPAEPVIPIVPDTRMSEYLEAQTRTADAVFSAVTENVSDDENVIFSPFSFYTGMSLIANGAEGECRKELLALLNVSDMEALNRYNSQLINNFPNLDQRVTLNIANSVWVDNGMSVKSDYLQNLSEWYACEPQKVNFGTTDAMSGINRWIENRTNGMIPDFVNTIPEGPFMLVNALYFEAAWTTPFDKSKTEPAPFTPASGDFKWVDMMHNPSLDGNYCCTDREKTLTLPFGNERFSITFALPAEGLGMSEYLAQLRTEGFHTLCGKGERKTVDVRLPRMSLSVQYEMDAILSTLGQSALFVEQEWPLIAEGLNTTIDDIWHGVAFKMDEEGAKAAAVTGNFGLISPAPESKPEFTADRPFVFIISENACNVPLFMGVVNTLGQR